MNHPHHSATHYNDAPQVLPVGSEASHAVSPTVTGGHHTFDDTHVRGTDIPIAHIDELAYIPAEESLREKSATDIVESLKDLIDSTVSGEGRVRDGEPDTRSLYERYPGNYPFPQYHRTGKKLPNGKDVIAATIPPQPVNYAFDRRKFDIELIRAVAAELGFSYARTGLANFLKDLIPRMVRT